MLNKDNRNGEAISKNGGIKEAPEKSDAEQKVEKLKKALKYHIEKELPGKTLQQRIERLAFLNPGELSKILNRKIIPSIDKIFAIEQELGINILLINYTESANSKKIREVVSETDINIYKEIKQNYGSDFDEMISEIADTFKEVTESSNLIFTIRKKKSYVSINLVPDDSSIGGIHLLMIRYREKDKRLRIHFMAPDRLFKDQIEDKQQYHLEKTGLATTYIPAKKAGNANYEEEGQPVVLIRKITKDEIKKVCYLAMKVYEIQTGFTLQEIRQ